MFKSLFELRGKLDQKTSMTIQVVGLAILLLAWHFITAFGNIPSRILPSPIDVFTAYPSMEKDYRLTYNFWYSIQINFRAIFEAILISLPLGFMMGLSKHFEALFQRPVDAMRFLPISALLGLFMVWFGIGDNMKVQFLAFSVTVYLIPAVAIQVKKVEEVYIQAIKTLGASKFQQVTKVFIPKVLSEVYGDIINIIAISWTYIIIAEMINPQGGIGSLIYKFARKVEIDNLFALLFLILVWGVFQDFVLKLIGKVLIRWKNVEVKE